MNDFTGRKVKYVRGPPSTSPCNPPCSDPLGPLPLRLSPQVPNVSTIIGPHPDSSSVELFMRTVLPPPQLDPTSAHVLITVGGWVLGSSSRWVGGC